MTDTTEKEKTKRSLLGSKKKKKQNKHLCGPEMQQTCKAVSWANAAAYQALSLQAASGNWKFSSGGTLGLRCSTQDGDQSQHCYREPGAGADQPSWFSQDFPWFSPENPKSQNNALVLGK